MDTENMNSNKIMALLRGKWQCNLYDSHEQAMNGYIWYMKFCITQRNQEKAATKQYDNTVSMNQ